MTNYLILFSHFLSPTAPPPFLVYHRTERRKKKKSSLISEREKTFLHCNQLGPIFFPAFTLFYHEATRLGDICRPQEKSPFCLIIRLILTLTHPPLPSHIPRTLGKGVKKYEKSDYPISAEAEIPMPVDFIYQSKTFDSFFLVHT